MPPDTVQVRPGGPEKANEMGYYMDLVKAEFKILREDFEKTLVSIKTLAGKETITIGSGPPHFSWVSTEEFLKAETLDVALRAWRWKPVYDDELNIISLEFTGQNLGDDKIMFRAIAPHVQAGSFIEMRGDDNHRWKWLFNRKAVREIPVKVVLDKEDM